MTKDDVQRLFEHMLWADARVLEALAAWPGIPARAVELYAHIVGAELVWLDRVERKDQSVPAWPAPEAGLEACRDLSARAGERYRAFFEALPPERLSQPIHYANSAGQEFDTRLDDILVHVSLHGVYHRGQISMILRDAGAEPNPTDYIVFIRNTRGAAGQPPG